MSSALSNHENSEDVAKISMFASQYNVDINKNNLSLSDKIKESLQRMDILLKENFELRRSIVFERKRNSDLNTAY